ncbi:MAG: HAMP domain-containing histidine kinase [Spirochaetia bacterium]|nr:HAMP domain-containing histidine kinase [Spirochaetia bacterium]
MSYFEPNEIYAYLTLKVNSNSNFVNYTEKTLSYIFIGGLFLLLLIGVICILSIYQMLRIKNQRDKEREFTASITHELRTPLTVIRSASDNLCENLVKKEKIPSYGQLIKQQAIRLNSMIENLLAYSKIEGNKFYKKNENKVNLKEFFETLKIQNIALSKEKDITINWIFKNLENIVYLDKDLLELVISNLISNSIFHAYNEYKGEIRIFAQFSKQKKELFCTIEDDGIGISIKEQKYIYNSYYRGEKSKEYQERGTGLGLFIVKRNVSILGGKIKLQSPYKRLNGKIKPGCHFELIIPCRIEKI